jgi:hypothetical protein
MNIQLKSVTILELKRLLHELNDKQSYICVRYRLLGEMWQTDFVKIATIDDSGVLFYNETTGRFAKLSSVGKIIQFEIDHSFQNFQPHFHYDVIFDDSTT